MNAIHSDSDTRPLPYDYLFTGPKSVQQIIDDLAISGEGTVIALQCGVVPFWGAGENATTDLQKAIKDAYADFNRRRRQYRPRMDGNAYIINALTTVRIVRFLYTPVTVIQEDDEEE